MPVWLTAAFVGWFVRNVLATIGVGTVAYVGFDAALTAAGGLIKSNLGGIPADAAGLLGLAGVDFAINIILSAYTVKVAMRAVGKLGVLSGT